MVLAADYPFLDVFWTMILFFSWVVWIWMMILILSDIFRRHDISGWAKAAWIVFMIILPFIGVLVYLIAHGKGMAERRVGGPEGRPGELRRLRPQDRDGRRLGRLGRRDRAGEGAARERHHQPGRVRAAEGEGARLSR